MKAPSLVALLLGLNFASSLNMRHVLKSASRRDVLSTVGTGFLVASSGLTKTAPAVAADDIVPVYFGVGCFWHVQHEFVEAEKRILGRKEEEFTALAGYAGGSRTAKVANRPDLTAGTVCYHNMQGVEDYGKQGHGEVVGLRVPAASVKDFAAVYFDLFDKNGDRPDKGDRGPEYRSLLGLPGGVSSPLFPAVAAAAEARGVGFINLLAGHGNDADTLGKKAVWVMDTTAFPFYQGEVYHQYHDGFMPGEDYPSKEYNGMRERAYKAGRLQSTGCPDSVA